MALLEADVALPVVRDFIARVKEKALGQEVMGSLKPGQALVGIVNRELVATMGEGVAGLDLTTQPPAVILMAGLQGAGKTTSIGKLTRHLADAEQTVLLAAADTFRAAAREQLAVSAITTSRLRALPALTASNATAKLAKHLIEKRKKKVLTVSADVYRPAAIEQLKTVTRQAGAEWFPSTPEQKPHDIALAAIDHARRHYFDVLLVDTAGRLAIDEALMAEIRDLHATLKPVETLFVVDAMQGQDAINRRPAVSTSSTSKKCFFA